MTEYTECDQCIRRCSVKQLRCENGRRRYLEVTGKKYEPQGEASRESKADQDSGAAYRRKIRERRARKSKTEK